VGSAYDSASYEVGARTAGPKAGTGEEDHTGKTDGEPEFSNGVADGAIGEETEGTNEAASLSVTRHEEEAAAAEAPKASTSKAKASAA
jgi:hypothetical protein